MSVGNNISSSIQDLEASWDYSNHHRDQTAQRTHTGHRGAVAQQQRSSSTPVLGSAAIWLSPSSLMFPGFGTNRTGAT